MHKKVVGFVAIAAMVGLLLAGCAGEGSAVVPKSTAASTVEKWSAPVLNIDFATYNPLSLIIKNKGWLEAKLGDRVKVNWGAVGWFERSKSCVAFRRGRYRLDRWIRCHARSLKRFADQNHRRLFPARLGCHCRTQGFIDQVGRRSHRNSEPGQPLAPWPRASGGAGGVDLLR